MSSESVVVELQGGLGNQLFGWAAGYALAKKLNCELMVDTSLLNQRGYQLNSFEFGSALKVSKRSWRLTSTIARFSNRRIFTEESFNFDRKFLEIQSPGILRGYFQSWKYHREFQEQIYQEVRKLAGTSTEFGELQQKFDFPNLTAIHVRRGDYKDLEAYHGTMRSSYYREALESLSPALFPGEDIVVFSDEPNEAREIMPNAKAYIGPKDLISPAENLVLMSTCKNIVGANSTFSLWAGMIMKSNTSQRVFPKPWFTSTKIDDSDLLPPEFIRIGHP
jgi:hypothetical protein